MKLRVILPILVLVLCSCHRVSGQPTHRDLLRKSGFSWSRVTTEHFRVYTERGSEAEQMAELLGLQLEQSYQRARRLLQIPEQDETIHVFAVGSRDRMERLVGRSIDGLALHRRRVIAMVFGTQDGHTAAEPTHEVMHIVAMNTLGVGPVWLNEGFAVYAGGRWRGRDLHEVAREFRAGDQLVELNSLMRNFRDVDPNLAFPQAGSFVRFLHESFGMPAIRALWIRNDTAFQQVTKRSLEEAEQNWRDFLARDMVSPPGLRLPAPSQ